MNETFVVLKVNNISKEYKLGQIGSTTIREELQRLRAKIQHKEDPTKSIGAKQYNKGEVFKALDNICFEVKNGERLGIIGHNGAGKSTLLKLISRITTPTSGEIELNGRVASMLEVGTGFHGELTGRENIYMNGAILGMTKKEINSKIEDIIDFSECRQFIDTPVKRYSSGMYVKLAFAVAAHLDAEIMIMDEVLAVGDVAFQRKCIDKMNDVSLREGRAILYVSHNMNTIKQLCDRVIVLDHGRMVFDGDVESGISIYMNDDKNELKTDLNLSQIRHWDQNSTYTISLNRVLIEDKVVPIFEGNENLKMHLFFNVHQRTEKVFFRFTVINSYGIAVGTAVSDCIDYAVGCSEMTCVFECCCLSSGKYYASIGFFHNNEDGSFNVIDHIPKAFCFEIKNDYNENNIRYDKKNWGSTVFKISIQNQAKTR